MDAPVALHLAINFLVSSNMPPPLPLHSHPVVVDSSSDGSGGGGFRLCGVIRADTDGVYVSSLVGLDPQLLDDLVDVVHLASVETHNRTVKGSVVLLQVTARQLRRLQTRQVNNTTTMEQEWKTKNGNRNEKKWEQE